MVTIWKSHSEVRNDVFDDVFDVMWGKFMETFAKAHVF